MKNATLREFLPLIKSIHRLAFKKQGHTIQNLSDKNIEHLTAAIAEVVFQRGSLKLSNKKTGKLRTILTPYKRELKHFLVSSGATRRRRLKQSGGAILSLLISTLLPVLIGQIATALTKKKK